MFTASVEHLQAAVHATILGKTPRIEWFIDRVIDFVTSPLTGLRTRSYWPELVAGLLIAFAVFLLRPQQGRRSPRSFWTFCFPAAMWRHRSTWIDWQIIVVNQFLARSFNLTWRINGALLAGFVVSALTAIFGPSPHLVAWSTTTLVLYTVLFGLADDFGYYLFHLASHRIPALWAFHKVHHSAETLTVLANVRAHPVEYAVLGPAKALTTSLVLGPALYLGTGEANLVDIMGMNLMAVLYCVLGTQLHHSHIWISWGRTVEHVLISPAMHQIHHSTAPRHWNRNMGGNFALWDWMFGTLYIPHGREDLRFGLGDGVPQPHPNVVAAYVLPFWEILPERLRQALRRRYERLSPLVPNAFDDIAEPVAGRPPP
jgi:sterol desaturase/sphingolipid hydroxylase (fatty acid hydroxylase superfamily)